MMKIFTKILKHKNCSHYTSHVMQCNAMRKNTATPIKHSSCSKTFQSIQSIYFLIPLFFHSWKIFLKNQMTQSRICEKLLTRYWNGIQWEQLTDKTEHFHSTPDCTCLTSMRTTYRAIEAIGRRGGWAEKFRRNIKPKSSESVATTFKSK